VAGFGDFSAKGGHDRAVLIGLVFLSAVLGSCSLTLLMEGREAQAAGPCGSGGLAPLGAGSFGRRNAGCVLREPRLSVLDFGLWPGSAVTRQYSDRPVAGRFRLVGHWESKAQCFKLESLILAQNERWRQA
jgi:hypothetical protein